MYLSCLNSSISPVAVEVANSWESDLWPATWNKEEAFRDMTLQEKKIALSYFQIKNDHVMYL